MKKILIYAWALVVFCVTGCSNLDESGLSITKEEADASIICSESFDGSIGSFTEYSESGNQKWTYDSNGYMIMTGHVGSSYYENIDWLISPEVDLTSITTAYFSFDYVARYFSDATSEATVWISEDYASGKTPTEATWTQLTIPPFSDPGSWPSIFPNSGELSLTSYVGKKIHIAFKYKSSSTKAGTWELNNFVVKKGDATVEAKLIYSNSFGSSKGDFTAISTVGDQKWEYSSGYSCMMITGYVGSRYANEDWLVSPEIDLSTIANSYVTFEHAGKYFGTLSSEATVWVSENYTDSAHFTSATWTKLPIMNYFSNTAFTYVNTGKLDLSAYAGKKIRVALKYSSTNSVAGTWEVRNFNVFEGKASGNEDVPFSVAQACSSQSGGNAWVEGYVVGYAQPFKSQYVYFFNADTCTQVTNVLLADSINGLYSTNCIALQLPRGTIRSLINLKDNKSSYGQKVKVYGTLSSNVGIAGIVNPMKYLLQNGSSGVVTTTTLYSETFATSLGSFTTNSVKGAQAWKFASGFGASMSGFASSVSNENEDWLISPEIDLSSVSSAAMTFDHTINKGVIGNMTTEQTLWITTDNGTTWEKLPIVSYPAGNTWTFVNAGEISLDAYVGNKVKVAFKYTCGTASSATWEINKFLVFY